MGSMKIEFQLKGGQLGVRANTLIDEGTNGLDDVGNYTIL